jgi:hypothetical protein
LELALRYARSGRTQGSAKLKDRLEDSRVRMECAPALVHTFLSEMCYVSWLLGRGDLAEARRHVSEAEQKARKIEILLQRQRCADARCQSLALRQRSETILKRSRQLVEHSVHLLSRSAALYRQFAPRPESEAAPRRRICA